jgi:hypothetical protein
MASIMAWRWSCAGALTSVFIPSSSPQTSHVLVGVLRMGGDCLRPPGRGGDGYYPSGRTWPQSQVEVEEATLNSYINEAYGPAYLPSPGEVLPYTLGFIVHLSIPRPITSQKF